MRAHRVLVVGFLVVATLGATLTVRSWLARRAFQKQEFASGTSAKVPLPRWWNGAPEKRDMIAGLQPVPPSANELVEATRRTARDLMADTGRGRFRARMVRTLENDTRLSAELHGEFDWRGMGDGDLTLTAVRENGDTVVIDATVSGGALVSGGMDGRDGALGMRPGLPVGIGDLQVSDLSGVYRAAETGTIEAVGLGESGNLVLDLDFAEAADDPAGVRGCSALLWLSLLSRAPVRVAVFNRDDRLVRVAEDFDRASDGTRSVVIRSLPNRSRTRFELVSFFVR